MKKFRLGKHTLEIYESIEELPVTRYHKFNRFALVDACIGSTLQDFDSHLERVFQYLQRGKQDLAEKELLNLRHNVYLIQEELSPKLLSFAALVKNLDGKEITDLSDASLKEISKELGDISLESFSQAREEVKKKLETELQTYFPALFDNSSVKDYYDKLRKRSILVLEQLLSREKAEDPLIQNEINLLNSALVLYSDPQTFSGEKSLDIQQDKHFENTCLALSQSLGVNPKQFTVLEYYNALLFLQEQNKKMKSKTKSKK